MMTSERRQLILKTLCKRRCETISNLAIEFGVSERTIRRDIEVMSLYEPIYTMQGRYNGGVYIEASYRQDGNYFEDSQKKVLEKILSYIERQNEETLMLQDEEIRIFRNLISVYSKPTVKKSK